MTCRLFLFAALLCTGGWVQAAPLTVAPPDSIGVEYRNNTALIKHQVTIGETLYGLARRYKVAVEAIVGANPTLKQGLQVGQVVYVPRTRVLLTAPPAKAVTRSAAGTDPSAAALALPRDARGNRIYTVKPGQTLYAISQRFGVSSTALLQLNRLPAGGQVNVGQRLIIVPAGTASTASVRPAAAPPRQAAPTAVPGPEPVEAVAAKPAPAKPTPAPTRPEPVRETPPAPREEPRPVAKEEPKEKPRDEQPDEVVEDKGPSRASEVVKRVTESGLAAVIPNANTVKYLALHKTAPTGSIVEVRNIMNNVSVFVRVIGQLPDTGENSNIIIRLSPRAVEKLATPDQRFRVEISYLP